MDMSALTDTQTHRIHSSKKKKKKKRENDRNNTCRNKNFSRTINSNGKFIYPHIYYHITALPHILSTV